ncbi:MAG: nicotinate-nucleotide adenylyltransferase [Bacteroidales bacterium]|nr:nicotinate-nucleotide adenylyltransferase [Bacteroidales bacterium]
MKIGLFFGSFNPIHIGHLAIANYMVEFSDIDKIWFVVSPQNPFKTKHNLLAEHHRLRLVDIAIEDDLRFKSSNIEFHLPKPSYTIDTLTYLKEKYPNEIFVLIMGEDNLKGLHKWKNYEKIIDDYAIYVYPRDYKTTETNPFKNITLIEAPKIEVSASFIRNAIKNKQDVRYFMHHKVAQYVEEMHFYE